MSRGEIEGRPDQFVDAVFAHGPDLQRTSDEDRSRDALLVGIVFYTGPQSLPFGPRLRALPISALWQATP